MAAAMQLEDLDDDAPLFPGPLMAAAMQIEDQDDDFPFFPGQVMAAAMQIDDLDDDRLLVPEQVMVAPVQIEDPDDELPLFPGPMAQLNPVPLPMAMIVPPTQAPVIILNVAPSAPHVPLRVLMTPPVDEGEDDEDEFKEVDDQAIPCAQKMRRPFQMS